LRYTTFFCRVRFAVALLPPFMALAQTPGKVSFQKDVAPLLAAKCWGCHGGSMKINDLALDTREDVLRGGKHGPALVPGKPEESLVYRKITGLDQPQMPFGGRLSDDEIAVFRAWIDQGAPWDAKPVTTTAGLAPGAYEFTAAQRAYWFFQPIPKIATARQGARPSSTNPIDAIVNAAQAAKGIRANPPADKVTLLRRATLDLTGLPPTPEEVQVFLTDNTPDAFAKVVDQLLASPQYGERWGRQWLDVARYADTNGFKADEARPNIWRYRDYVVKAFNDDKPYDRFIREQIAGDEMYPESVEAHIATGFLRHYTDETNQPSMELRREELLQNITDTVSTAFMGLTYGCAKCHNHKFDPILQKDYYRLQAFFENVRAKDDYIPLSGGGLEEEQKLAAEYEEKTRDIRAAMHALVERFAAADAEQYMNRFSEGTREAIRTPPEQRTPYQSLLAFQGMPQITYQDEKLASRLKGDEKKRFDELAAQLKQFDSLKPDSPHAQTMIDQGVDSPKSYVLAAGSWNAPKEEVHPGFLSILDPSDARYSEPEEVESTGRRTVLANWLADPNNPLTPRVMANRIWQGHFGTGIVATSGDFGIMGDHPTNQALLDYLAASFVENGWSIKKLHRLIMLSNTYRESSLSEPAAAAIDPDNKLMWRYPRHRAEAEVVRDAMLFTAGRLNLEMGGPGVRPDLPEGVDTSGYSTWTVNKDEAETRRRSIYVYVKRVLTYPMFEAFDAATSEESCPRRFSTVLPSQALTLMNDKYVLDWSRSFAGRVLADTGLTREQQINRAYRIAFGRAPQPDEITAVSDFLTRQAALVSGRMTRNEPVLLPDQIPAGTEPSFAAAFVDFCHALMSSNEFLYIN
jgi:hypothetical protein